MSGQSRSGVEAGVEADLDWCHDAVQDVSRTFALTVDTLEEPMASRICLGYLLCRIPDTIEDARHVPPAEQAALLRSYARALDPEDDATVTEFVDDAGSWIPPDGERSDDWRVVAAAPRVRATFDRLPADVRRGITPPVLELVDGMATFVERHAETGGIRIGDRAELDEYCHYAAGTVGTLITNLLARGDVDAADRETLRETAESFSLLLQLVNVATDVHDDYARENNVYLPASWLAAEGVPQDAVLDAEYRDGAAAVVSRTERYAASFLDDAQRYLEAMPFSEGNTLPAWGVPYLLAVGTLRELAAAPADALTERGVTVSREEVFAVVDATHRGDRSAIAELRSTVASEPLHEANPSVPST